MSESKPDELIDFDKVLGHSKDGQWVVENKKKEDLEEKEEKTTDKEESVQESASQVRYIVLCGIIFQN